MSDRDLEPRSAIKRRIHADLVDQFESLTRELDDRLTARRRLLRDIRDRYTASDQVHRSLYQPLYNGLRLAWGCAKAEAHLKADGYIAHDDVALIAADYMTKKHGGILIYDAIEPFEHDQKTSGYDSSIPREVLTYYTLLNRAAVLRAQTRFTTSEPLADFLQQRYGAPFVVLPNYISHSSHSPSPCEIREKCGCTYQDFLVLYVNSIYPASRFDEVLRALSHCDKSYHIVNVGDVRPQNLKNELDGMIAELDLAQRVHFLPTMPYDAYISSISACNAALVWLDDENINCVANLHNRYLDAIAAGLPLLSSQNAAFATLLEKYDLGLIVPDRNPTTFAGCMRTIREKRDSFVPGLQCAQAALRWENVEERFAKAVSECRSVTIITWKDPHRNQRIQRQIQTLRKHGIQISGIGTLPDDPTMTSQAGAWFNIPASLDP